jgi:hypothetical protein
MAGRARNHNPLTQIGIVPETHTRFYEVMNRLINEFRPSQRQSIRSFLQSIVEDVAFCYWISNTEKSNKTIILLDMLRRNTYYKLKTDCKWYKKWKEMDKGNWLDYFILTSYKAAHREIMANYKEYRKYEAAK